MGFQTVARFVGHKVWIIVLQLELQEILKTNSGCKKMVLILLCKTQRWILCQTFIYLRPVSSRLIGTSSLLLFSPQTRPSRLLHRTIWFQERVFRFVSACLCSIWTAGHGSWSLDIKHDTLINAVDGGDLWGRAALKMMAFSSQGSRLRLSRQVLL